MKRNNLCLIGAVAILLSTSLFSTVSLAQVPTEQVSHSTKHLSFQQSAWQTMHLHDAGKAELTAARLTELGCEVSKNQHDGHIDLRFRCVNWQTLDLDTDQQVKQWADWMQQSGLQTIVRDPADDPQMPTVSYRLTENQRAHLHNMDEAAQIISIFKMLGCQVETSDHNGHLDLSVNCPEWITMGVESEAVAHKWQAWLNSNGFETKHTHVHQ